MKHIVLCLCLLLAPALPATAGPQEDAQYIIDQTVTRTMFEAAIQAQRSMLISALTNEFRAQGISFNDTDAFFDIFLDEFIEEFTGTMKQKTLLLYRDLFTDSQLADLAAFYRTETGQALIAQTPALIQSGAQMGRVAGEKAGRNAGARVARRMEQEGIVIDNDKSLTQRLIEALK